MISVNDNQQLISEYRKINIVKCKVYAIIEGVILCTERVLNVKRKKYEKMIRAVRVCLRENYGVIMPDSRIRHHLPIRHPYSMEMVSCYKELYNLQIMLLSVFDVNYVFEQLERWVEADADNRAYSYVSPTYLCEGVI